MARWFENSSGKSKIVLPLLFVAVLLAGMVVVHTAWASCCSNPGFALDQGETQVCVDSASVWPTEGDCCPPSNPDYYNDSLAWWPDDQSACALDHYAATCDNLPTCEVGCCYDESGTYTDVCGAQIESLCLLQSPNNLWVAGFPTEEQYENNPCYDLSYVKAIDTCPTITGCTQYGGDPGNCSESGCYYCPDDGPASGAGQCFDECANNCLGDIQLGEEHWSISNATTGYCQQPILLPPCTHTNCEMADADCRCAPDVLTNNTHFFCCELQAAVFSNNSACEANCVPNCIINRSIEYSQNAFPGFTDCLCGPDLFPMTASGYCCGYDPISVYNISACFPVGSLSGRVYDSSGATVYNAQVSIAGQSTTSDATGFYEFLEVFADSYTAVALADGYAPASDQVTIHEGANTHDFTLFPEVGECTAPTKAQRPNPFFETRCVKGEAAIDLTWVNRCPNVQGFHIWRINPTDGSETKLTILGNDQISFRDEGLFWNSNYDYVLGVWYDSQFQDPELGDVDTANYTDTGRTGDEQCAGVTTREDCVDVDYEKLGPLVRKISCTECNDLEYPYDLTHTCADIPGYPADSLCVGPNENGEALCLKGADCGAIGNPFGLFATEEMCLDSGEIQNACYYDYSPTVVDACYSCGDIQSCFEYRSQDACDDDSCYISKQPGCYYQEFNNELGKGLCIQQNYTGTEYCHLCDDPFIPCDQPLCTELGLCYFDEGRCSGCEQDMTCSDFTTENACTGGQDWEIDPTCPAKATPSNNPCGIIYCAWTGTECIWDPDGNGQYDGNYDIWIPETNIMNWPTTVVNEMGFIVNLNVSIVSNTYYCIDSADDCCPTRQIDNIPNPKEKSVDLSQGASGTGTYYFRYYSQSTYSDAVELIKSRSFLLDNEAPQITITYEVVDADTEHLSDVIFTIDVSELATCTDTFTPTSGPGTPPVESAGLNVQFVTAYTSINDGSGYIYTVDCTDRTGQTANAWVRVDVDRDQFITDDEPLGVTTAESPVVLRLKTLDEADCEVARVDGLGELIGSYTDMIRTVEGDGRYLHRLQVDSTASDTFFYRVLCSRDGNYYDQTLLSFTADHLGPVTAAMYNSSLGLVPLDDGEWYAKADIAFECTDVDQGPPDEFGCDETIYCVVPGNEGCSPATVGSSYFNPSASTGMYTVCYSSTDVGGNSETEKCTTYRLDTTAPPMPTVDDSSPILSDPEVYYEGDRLRVSIFAEDAESGVWLYAVSLEDSDGNLIVSRKEFEVDEVDQDVPHIIWLTYHDSEWLEDLEGDKIPLVVGETYYFSGWAVDYAGYQSSEGVSDGVTIVQQNFTPSHCENGIRDADEIATDCGGSCPPCGQSAECGNNVLEQGEECEPGRMAGIDCESLGFMGGTLRCTDECALDTSECIPDNGGSWCGDSIIDDGEKCDDGNFGDIDQCTELDSFFGGVLGCDATCDFDTHGCYGPESYCGDGFIDGGEQCDGLNWGAVQGCENLGEFTSGVLVCDANCRFDTSGCTDSGSYCGDGVIDAGEQCDSTNWGPITSCTQVGDFSAGDLACGGDCEFDTSACIGSENYCGDGTIDAGEQCEGTDFGNIDSCQDMGDFESGILSCTANCQIDTSGCVPSFGGECGDGIIDAGEECDGQEWGPVNGCTNWDEFTGGALVCDANCRFDTSSCTGGPGSECGDGTIDAGEQCDGTTIPFTDCSEFGFESGDLSCDASCSVDTTMCINTEGGFCGDGTIDAGEQCDSDTLGPLTDCISFGYDSGALSCTADCMLDMSVCTGGSSPTECGDEDVGSGEQCDGTNWADVSSCIDFDSFSGGNLFCDADCMFDTGMCTGGLGAECGDGILDGSEQCDGDIWAVSSCSDFGFSGGTLVCTPICMLDTTGCTSPMGGNCGDETIDAGEQCDSQEWGPVTGCSNFDDFTEGVLSCDTNCEFDTSMCSGGPGSYCGDGRIDGGEQCDGLNWGAVSSCTDFDFTRGTLVCTADCQFDTSRCVPVVGGSCGDGVIGASEQCDGEDWGVISACTDFDLFGGGTLVCDEECTFDTDACIGGVGSECGDGVIDSGEQCDGNNWGIISECTDLAHFIGGDLTCTNDCKLDTTNCIPEHGGSCGDDVIDGGEECDGTDWGDITSCSDFGFTGGDLGCNPRCRFDTTDCIASEGGRCGDGVLDSGEVCDGASFGIIDECIQLGSFTGGTLGCTDYCHFDTAACEVVLIPCIDDIDCESLYCNPDGFCSEPNCNDGWWNGDEDGIDCGGWECDPCGDDDDKCNNGLKDTGEMGIDCGGVCSRGCLEGDDCENDEDCESLNCVDGVCLASNCADGKLNGGESDVDCGAFCPEQCAIGETCFTSNDCVSGNCERGVCAKADSGRTDPDDPDDPTKKRSWLWILFFLLLVIILGVGGYYGYMKYMEAKHPEEEETGPAMPIQQAVQQKKRELSPREQMLISRKRRAEKKKDRESVFDSFDGKGKGPKKPAEPGKEGAAEAKKPAGTPKKVAPDDVFSAFDEGATGAKAEAKPEEKPAAKPTGPSKEEPKPRVKPAEPTKTEPTLAESAELDEIHAAVDAVAKEKAKQKAIAKAKRTTSKKPSVKKPAAKRKPKPKPKSTAKKPAPKKKPAAKKPATKTAKKK